MTFFVRTHSGSAMPCNPYSSEKERKEVELFINIERQAAYELRKNGHYQKVTFKQK